MPNSFLPPSMQGLSSTPSGLIMVGDAWNMRHPLTGGGMTVAFNDAVLLTEYLGVARLGEGRDGLEDWDRVGEGLREWFWRRKSLAGVVNVLSMALYDLFGGADGEWTWTRQRLRRTTSTGLSVAVSHPGRADGRRARFGDPARRVLQIL
jgi:2-polyprenyl-6-methoxyphenol hydroxylase-like FAD-dependent oxidoreductase